MFSGLKKGIRFDRFEEEYESIKNVEWKTNGWKKTRKSKCATESRTYGRFASAHGGAERPRRALGNAEPQHADAERETEDNGPGPEALYGLYRSLEAPPIWKP